MRVRLMSRTANSFIERISVPGSLRRVKETLVRSTPVRGVGVPGRPTSTNRVRAPRTSATPSAIASSPSSSPARAGAAHASCTPSATKCAAAAFDVAEWKSTPGKFASTHCLTWGYATGCVVKLRTDAGSVPGRTRIENSTPISVSR